MTDRKLSPNLVWLFAAGTLILAILVTKLMTSPLSPKVWGAIYFALFGAGAAASTFLTRAGALRAIGAFALGGVGLGVFYFVSIRSHMEGAGAFGTGTAIVFMIAFAIDAIVAGIAGSLFGLKVRKGLVRPGFTS
ncbi:MAG: hypothetical protein KF773_22985 [Deltaproteobacteria bacterium]|nr:hypothetical protein [Deltaproteobacteria bacterium]MCW5809253.1 hypothetical protein [Deltaproteobacteria bacterium]